jgi:hypothetical protein
MAVSRNSSDRVRMGFIREAGLFDWRISPILTNWRLYAKMGEQ